MTPPARNKPTAPPIDPAIVRRVSANEDIITRFAREAGAVGTAVSRCGSAGLAAHVARVVREIAGSLFMARPRVAVEPSLSMQKSIEAAIHPHARLASPDDGSELLFAVDIGITGVQAAVAETGSIVCGGEPGGCRSTCIIPPIHVAVVFARQVVPDLLDLFDGTASRATRGNVSIITGPSKTADIEGILVTGVHGPAQVHIVIVDD